MRYALSILLGLLLGTFPALHLKGQSLTVVGADSLRLLLRADKADTNQVAVLLRLSAYYQHRTLNYTHNLDTALTLANQAYALSKQLHDDKGQQEAIIQQGKIFIRQEKLSKVKKMLSTVSDVTHIRLLLELGKSRLWPTYSKEANLDSALLLFDQAGQLSKRFGSQSWQRESQMMTGVAYVFKGDCERSKAWFSRVIGAYQREGDKAGELRVWLRWAAAICTQWKCYDSEDTLSRAFVLAHQLGDKPREAFLWLMVGTKRSIEGNQKQAEQEALKALTIQKAIGYSAFNRAFHTLVAENDYLQHLFLFNFLNANSVLAHIVETTPNMTKELFYKLEVIRDLEHSRLHEDLDWPYFWLGNSYYELGQYTEAVAYYRQSLAVSHQKGKVAVYAGMIRRIAESLTREGSTHEALKLLVDFTRQHPPLDHAGKMNIAVAFGQCYSALGQYKLAEKYYLESAAWNEKAEGTFIAWVQLSKFYVAWAQYAKAAPYLRKLSTYVGVLPAPETMQLYLLQFKVDSAQANYPSALRNYQRYTALKDSLLNETTSKQMAELDIKYQTRQKEQILKLRQKDITLLTQQSKTRQTQRNAFVCGTLLLAALLGLSYNRYRQKQRSNQLLQAQQQLIYQKNEDLQRLLVGQDRLLKEIHHRVKNNLQVIMSLLDSQADSLQDKAALLAIQESQHRVQAMALIHQKLYQAEGVSHIPMKAYIEEMVAYLYESYDLPQPIRLLLDIEPIELDVTQAVPLGLIINEAITNAFKYAFPEGRSGTVRLSLHQLKETTYKLIISDDGIGLPVGYQPGRSRSLGMELLYGFSRQLGGKLQISSPPGLSIILLFEEEQLVKVYD